jgi:photosystem II stability/assembly factor-like uncharacterized protein
MLARVTAIIFILIFCPVPGTGVTATNVARGDQETPRKQPTSESFSFADIYDLTWGNNQFVAVGNNGLVLTSPNGAEWKVRRIKNSQISLKGVAWGNDRYVGVGSAGIILTSSDGLAWTEYYPPAATGKKLMQVVWVNNRFVTVGDEGLILTSADGVEWAEQNSGTVDELLGVAGGNGRFVVVGKHGTIVTSSNGKDWTVQGLEGERSLNSVAWSGQEFVAVGDLGYGSVLARSLDGQEWELKEFTGFERLLSDITWSGTHFVVVGTDIAISPDGREWTFLNIGAPDTGYQLYFRLVAGVNDSYVATGLEGEVFISQDGMIWRGGKNIRINLTSGQTSIPNTSAKTSPVDEASEIQSERLQETIAGGLISFAMSGGSLLLYIVLQVWSIKRMRGGWRIFAILPLAPVAFILVATIIALNQSSNLWPVGIILWLPIAVGYLVLLLVLHTLFKRLSNKSTPAL